MMQPFPLPERDDTEIASRTIVVAMGGQATRLPVLSVSRNREWTSRFTQTMESFLGDVPDIDTIGGLAGIASLSVDRMVDLLAAYDESNLLGGAGSIADRATPSEVYDALRRVLSAAFPFASDLASLPGLRPVLIQAIAKAAASSTPTKPSPPTTGGRRRSSKKA